MRAPTDEPGKDTLATLVRVFAACTGTATAFGSALARCHGSDLLPLRLLFVHKPAVQLSASPTFRKYGVSCQTRFFPGSEALVVTSCDVFLWQPLSSLPELADPCWNTVATNYPLGNCDSPKLETSLDYLTQFRMVSNHPSPLGSYSRSGGARTRPEELVNPASPSSFAAGT